MPSEHDLLFLLHDVARQLRLNVDRRAAAHGMTRAQWVILFWLERQPGLSQKELAEIVEVEPITVGRLIDRLEARGMLERRADSKDRRIWRLHLCPPAAAALAEMSRERTELVGVITEGLAEADLSVIQQGLCRMKANVAADLRQREAARETDLHPAERVA